MVRRRVREGARVGGEFALELRPPMKRKHDEINDKDEEDMDDGSDGDGSGSGSQ